MNVSTRWFENYLVRYLVGTIIGSFCTLLSIAAIHSPANISNTISRVIESAIAGKIDSTSLLLIGSLGFLFCYISSTPITIIHTARMLGALPNRRLLRPATIWSWWWSLVVIQIILISALISLGMTEAENIAIFALPITLAVPAGYVALAQWAPVAAVLSEQKKIDHNIPVRLFHWAFNASSHKATPTFVDYYKNLARNRSKNPASEDFRCSYSHLREHSNSIFIVLLEVSLAASIFIVCYLLKDLTWMHRSLVVLSMFLAWITPTVFVWGIANSLEAELGRTENPFS